MKAKPEEENGRETPVCLRFFSCLYDEISRPKQRPEERTYLTYFPSDRPLFRGATAAGTHSACTRIAADSTYASVRHDFSTGTAQVLPKTKMGLPTSINVM